jgi:ribulose-phosphate 3-epimerase
MSRDIRITPSILNADFSQLDQEIKRIAAVSDLLHLDVMDDVFVPNFTFDFDAASAIIKSSVLAVDAHLMVAHVDEIAVQYAEIGCASVTIHAEATNDIPQTLKNIRKAGSRSSLGIKPNTDISDYESVIDDVDMFLIMTVEPGFGGQSFMENN